MENTGGIIAGIAVTMWVLRELVPILVKVIRHRSERPPPPPLPRSEMLTPQHGLPAAGESGRYPAVGADGAPAYVTRAEVVAMVNEIKAQLVDLATRHAALSRDVGRLEGMLLKPTGGRS